MVFATLVVFWRNTLIVSLILKALSDKWALIQVLQFQYVSSHLCENEILLL